MSDEKPLHEAEDDEVSRSQIKRDMLALQDLGGRLMQLGPSIWQRLPLSQELIDALEESRRIHEKTAVKRHRKRLGKLLRSADIAGIQAELQRLDAPRAAANQQFHTLERWRDRLLADDRAVEQLLVHLPSLERQTLRQLIRKAHQEREREQPPAAARKLFRYLREWAPIDLPAPDD